MKNCPKLIILPKMNEILLKIIEIHTIVIFKMNEILRKMIFKHLTSYKTRYDYNLTFMKSQVSQTGH